jgi:hypothetical protein
MSFYPHAGKQASRRSCTLHNRSGAVLLERDTPEIDRIGRRSKSGR